MPTALELAPAPLPLPHQLVQLHQEIKSLEEQVKAKKEEFRKINMLIAELWIGEGTQKQTVEVDGRRFTVYRKRNFMVNINAADRPDVVQALKDMGLSDMVKEDISTSSLKSWLLEKIREGSEEDAGFDLEQIPEELQGIIRTHQDVTIEIRKG